ncbi:hypothetical protein BH20ACI1_BH20ACI1_15310 [soil metagenome]
MNRTFNRIQTLLGCLAIIIGLSMTANAQFKAGIQGTVADSGGGVIAGASVTLTNKETAEVTKVVSNESGFYRFPLLKPGLYTITVEQEGFKQRVIDNVKVDAESIRGVDIKLEIGGISEIVTVEADNAPLETEDASVRKTITTDEILRLPQAGRDPYELVRLAPGVFGAGARSGSGGSVGLPNTSGPDGSSIGIFGTENRPAISANGQRVSANNFQIDGVSVNSQTWGGAAVITPTQEAVKEVQVTSSSYSAEDGRNSGAQIKVVSQNGTNKFHGSAFFNYGDPGWNAFTPRIDIPGTSRFIRENRVENRNKTFGGSLGGPIVRNKLFFFFAYEGLRQQLNDTYSAFIETDQLRQFIVSRGGISSQIVASEGALPRVVSGRSENCASFGNFFNANNCRVVAGGFDLGSPAGALGQYVTDPRLGGGFDGIPDVQFVDLQNPRSTDGSQYVTRIDYEATRKDKLAFSLFYTPRFSSGVNTAAQSRPMADINSDRLNYNTAFSYIRTFSSNIINEARVNFTKWGYNEVDANPATNFGIPRVEIEQFVPTNRISFGAPRGANTPGIIRETQFNLRDTVTVIRGNHAFRIGVDFRKDRNENPGTGAARPIYTFVGPWNFANDAPIFYGVTASLTGEPLAGQAPFNTGGTALFIQDDWKVRPNLTLNLGLRWEYFNPVSSEEGLGVLVFGPNGLVDSRIEQREKLWNPDIDNFGPQMGFAWTPERFKNKMVLRGGVGLGYDRLPNSLPANARRNPPNVGNFNICCGSAGDPFRGGQIVYTLGRDRSPTSFPRNPNIGRGLNPATGGPTVGTVEIYDINNNFIQPHVYRYSLEGQYELPYKLVGTLGYQGSRSQNFVRIEPLHLTMTPSPTFNPVFFGKSDVYGYYNAMNARLQRRFSNGFQFDLNYRFAKSLDTYSFEAPCACTNQTFPIDQSTEFGPSDFDVRHFITLSYLWDVPFFRNKNTLAGKLLGGWQLSGIMTRHTGFPFTPTINGSIELPNGRNIGSIRPVRYSGARPDSNSNANFLRAGGLFAGQDLSQIFSLLPNTNNSFSNNVPAIGRNTFFGPKYFNLDMSVQKRFGLPNLGVLGENPKFDIRFNFFNILNSRNIAQLGSASSNRINNGNFTEGTALLAGRVIEVQLRFSF